MAALIRNSSALFRCLHLCKPLLTTFQLQNFVKTCSVLSRTTPNPKQYKKQPYNQDTFVERIYYKRKRLKESLKSLLYKHSAQSYVNRAPKSIQPYLHLIRADKPIGTLLLYFPCAFSICLATPSGELPSFYYLGLFGIGSILMRGAGCIINDLWDQDIDKKVQRTKNRPLASGAVTQTDAIKYLFCHLVLSLGVLFSLNSTCVLIGFASMIPVILYPLAKRYTFFPQVVLGFTFNIGALMGYTAVTGYINWEVLGALYFSCIFWTVYYDTVYAFQDATDDAKIGVKSIALLFKQHSLKEIQEMDLTSRMDIERKKHNSVIGFMWCVALLHANLFTVAAWLQGLQGPVYLALILAVSRQFLEGYDFNPNSRNSCWKVFNDSKLHGSLLLLGIILDLYIRPIP